MGCGASSSQPPLFFIVEEGDDHKIRNLIRSNPGQATRGVNANGDTVLHHAAYMAKDGKANCVRALIESTSLDLNAKNKTGFTPLHMAMGHGKEECARELLRSGAKVDIAEPGEGNTALHLAAIHDRASCLQAAVDCQAGAACFNAKNKAGLAALHIIAAKAHMECLKVLVTPESTADVNVQSSTGNTPLHEAAAAGEREIAEALVAAKADVTMVNQQGRTAGQLAAQAGHRRLAEILGAKPREEDIAAGKAIASSGGGVVVEGDPEGLLPADEATRKRVQTLMDQTWKGVATCDRYDGKVSQYEVVSVAVNTNKKLWDAYVEAREDVNRSYVAKLTDIKTVLPEFDESVLEPRNLEVNEFFLFHGSKPQALTSICEQGFKIDLSGSNRGSLYGPGIYCAESSAKADEYAEDDKDGVHVGLYSMLLCRVCLGNPIVTEDVVPDVEELQRLLSTTDMHSIVGDREKARGTYREFVLCNANLVYPAYAIIYRRKEDQEN